MTVSDCTNKVRVYISVSVSYLAFEAKKTRNFIINLRITKRLWRKSWERLKGLHNKLAQNASKRRHIMSLSDYNYNNDFYNQYINYYSQFVRFEQTQILQILLQRAAPMRRGTRCTVCVRLYMQYKR